MSIASLTDARIHRTSAGDRRRRGVHVRAHREKKAPDRSRTITPLPGANQIARYIPTEAIAIYVAILALYAPLAPKPHTHVWQLDYTSRWYLFAAGLVGTAILVWLVYLGKSRAAGHKGRGKDVPVFEIAMVVFAHGGVGLRPPRHAIAGLLMVAERHQPGHPHRRDAAHSSHRKRVGEDPADVRRGTGRHRLTVGAERPAGGAGAPPRPGIGGQAEQGSLECRDGLPCDLPR